MEIYYRVAGISREKKEKENNLLRRVLFCLIQFATISAFLPPCSLVWEEVTEVSYFIYVTKRLILPTKKKSYNDTESSSSGVK